MRAESRTCRFIPIPGAETVRIGLSVKTDSTEKDVPICKGAGWIGFEQVITLESGGREEHQFYNLTRVGSRYPYSHVAVFSSSSSPLGNDVYLSDTSFQTLAANPHFGGSVYGLRTISRGGGRFEGGLPGTGGPFSLVHNYSYSFYSDFDIHDRPGTIVHEQRAADTVNYYVRERETISRTYLTDETQWILTPILSETSTSQSFDFEGIEADISTKTVNATYTPRRTYPDSNRGSGNTGRTEADLAIRHPGQDGGQFGN